MKGVTQKVYTAFRARKGKASQSVKFISETELEEIYKKNYWRVAGCDHMPRGIDYLTFDAAVNSGPSRGVRWTQRAVGVPADGQVGPVTLRAAEKVRDKASVVRKACAYRMSFLEALRHWDAFGRGWTRRVAGVEAKAVRMALEERAAKAVVKPAPEDTSPVPLPAVEQIILADARAAAEGAGKAVKKNNGAAGTSGAGGAGVGVIDAGTAGHVWVIVAAVVIGAVVASYFIWRAHTQRERQKVYRNVVKMGPQLS